MVKLYWAFLIIKHSSLHQWNLLSGHFNQKASSKS